MELKFIMLSEIIQIEEDECKIGTVRGGEQ
jgi:hypothetical protein